MSDSAVAPAADRRTASNLALRFATSLALIPAALAAIWVGGIVYAGIVLVIGLLAWREWGTITAPSVPAWAVAATAVPTLCGLAFFSAEAWTIAIPLITLPVVLAMAAAILFRSAGWLGAGLVYVALPCAGLISIRGIPETGGLAIVFVCAVVWATDTFAYFVGRSVGGIRLWPRVSPKKTWSGAGGGLLAAMLVGGIVSPFGFFDLGHGLLLAALLSIAAQAGDLLESAVKRQFHVKDSGTAIPGHGGILDRVDGLFGAAVAAWLIAGTGIGGALFAFPDATP